MDEGVTLYFADPARFSLFEICGAIIASKEMHPPGFYGVIHGMIYFFGTSEIALRFLPALFGIFNVLLIYILARVWGKSRTGLLAAILLAASSFHISMAQEARMYSMAIFFNLLAAIFISRWILLKRPKDIIMYGIALIIALYIHYYSILLWFFTGVFFIIQVSLKKNAEYKKLMSGWFFCSMFSFAFFLPWAAIIFKNQLMQATQIYNFNIGLPQLLSGFLQLFSGPAIILPGFWVFFAGSCVIIALIALGIRHFKEAGLFLGVLTFGTIFLAFIISAFTPLHIYQTKYLVIILPFFCLLLSEAILCFKLRALSILIILCWLGINFISWRNMTFDPYYGNKNYRLVAAYLSNEVKRDDPIIIINSMNLPAFFYYYKGLSKVFAIEKPEEIFLKNEIASSKRIWVFFCPLLFPETADILESKFKLLQARHTRNYFDGNIIVVNLLERK